MAAIPVHYVIGLAALLFTIGLIGLMTRRNLLFMLICIEIMLNSAGLAFVGAGAVWNQPDGQIMFLIILAVAAAEVAVGLALLLLYFRQHRTLDIDLASQMRG